MPSLVSDTEKAELQIIFGDIFDTFKRSITVHKEPIKTFSSIDINFIFGYGEPSQQANVSYTHQSKSFYATISYRFSDSDTDYVEDISSYVPGSIVKIKVEETCKDYITTGGQTEHVEFDGKKFNIISEEITSNFLGISYYVFFVQIAR
jgi:hypothetical protein